MDSKKSKNLLWAVVVIIVVLGVLFVFVKPQEGQIDSLSVQTTCIEAGGTWLAEFNECEYIDASTCSVLDGKFNECGSACRNETEIGPCTLQCVPFCKL